MYTQVRLFYKVFRRIDVDKSGTICVDEFFSHFKYVIILLASLLTMSDSGVPNLIAGAQQHEPLYECDV